MDLGSLANPKVSVWLSNKYTFGLELVPIPKSLGLVPADGVGAEAGGAAGAVPDRLLDGVDGGEETEEVEVEENLLCSNQISLGQARCSFWL